MATKQRITAKNIKALNRPRGISPESKKTLKKLDASLTNLVKENKRKLDQLKELRDLALEAENNKGMKSFDVTLARTTANGILESIGMPLLPETAAGDNRYLYVRRRNAKNLREKLDVSIGELTKAIERAEEFDQTVAPKAPVVNSGTGAVLASMQAKAVIRRELVKMKELREKANAAEKGDGVTAADHRSYCIAIRDSLKVINIPSVVTNPPFSGKTVGTRRSMARSVIQLLNIAIEQLEASLAETTIVGQGKPMPAPSLQSLKLAPPLPPQEVVVRKRMESFFVMMPIVRLQTILREHNDAVIMSLPENLEKVEGVDFCRAVTVSSREWLAQILRTQRKIDVDKKNIYITHVESSLMSGMVAITVKAHEMTVRDGVRTRVIHEYTIKTAGQRSTKVLVNRIADLTKEPNPVKAVGIANGHLTTLVGTL